MKRLFVLFALACWSAAARAADHPRPEGAPEIQYHGTAVINRVEPFIGLVNLSHGPVPEVGWSAMTQDLRMRPRTLAQGLVPGMMIKFQISRPDPMTYVITAVAPYED